MMAATFNGNPKATIISCDSRTNVSEETELVTFYEEHSETQPALSLAGIWMPKSGKTETTNTAYTTRQIGMDNI